MSTDDCWLWAGPVNQLGYGRYSIKIDGKWRNRPAHRLLYENLVGQIPEGLVLDHLCKVTTCVNPSHLEPVTLSENTKRGDAVKVQISKTHCPKGHPYSGSNLLITRPFQRGKQQKYRRCKTCTNEQQSRWYYNNREKALSWVKAQKEKDRSTCL